MNTYKTEQNHDFQIGDIIASEWGWEQTNVDFFKVVKATAKTVTLVELKSKAVSGDGWTGTVVPTDEIAERPSCWQGKTEKMYRPKFIGSEWIIDMPYGFGRRWDGNEIEYTAYA